MAGRLRGSGMRAQRITSGRPTNIAQNAEPPAPVNAAAIDAAIQQHVRAENQPDQRPDMAPRELAPVGPPAQGENVNFVFSNLFAWLFASGIAVRMMFALFHGNPVCPRQGAAILHAVRPLDLSVRATLPHRPTISVVLATCLARCSVRLVRGQPRIDVEALLRRLESLEQGQEVSVDQQKKSIVQYALRQASDFEKYEAIHMVERLKLLAREKRDDKTSFYSTVHASLWQRIGCPPEQFRSYVLALLGTGTIKRSWRQSARWTRPLGLETVNVGGGGHNHPRTSSLAPPRHQPGPDPIRRQAANRRAAIGVASYAMTRATSPPAVSDVKALMQTEEVRQDSTNRDNYDYNVN
eukprot:gene6726-7484_t